MFSNAKRIFGWGGFIMGAAFLVNIAFGVMNGNWELVVMTVVAIVWFVLAELAMDMARKALEGWERSNDLLMKQTTNKNMKTNWGWNGP